MCDLLAAHYAAADLFLYPSLTETFGNVTTESTASGLPVVAFNYAAAAASSATTKTAAGSLRRPRRSSIILAAHAARSQELRARLSPAARKTAEGISRTLVPSHGVRYPLLDVLRNHKNNSIIFFASVPIKVNPAAR
ncbi:MAG: glycosyltransferase [Nibricoccus sp.]